MTPDEIDLVFRIVGFLQEGAFAYRAALTKPEIAEALDRAAADVFDHFLPDDDDVLDALQFSDGGTEVFDDDDYSGMSEDDPRWAGIWADFLALKNK